MIPADTLSLHGSWLQTLQMYLAKSVLSRCNPDYCGGSLRQFYPLYPLRATDCRKIHTESGFFFFNRLRRRCPFHNQRPERTTSGNNTHLRANTPLDDSLRGPYTNPIKGMLVMMCNQRIIFLSVDAFMMDGLERLSSRGSPGESLWKRASG